MQTKSPPHSKEAEMMVLGCMLSSIDAVNAVVSVITENDFFFNEHRLIFACIQTFFNNDHLCDVHLVAEELKRRTQLHSVGGVPYLTTLVQYAGTSIHTEEYAEIVASKALLRRMITTARNIEREAYTDPKDVFSALDQAQQQLFVVGQNNRRAHAKMIGELLRGKTHKEGLSFIDLLQKKQEVYQTRGPEDPGITGLSTGFFDLDKIINGMGRSNLTILAARPAMGKTALLINIAESVCFKSKLPVAIFSLEMSSEQLVQRIIASQAEVDSEKIRTGSLSGEEFQRIVETVAILEESPLFIDDQPALSISDVRSRSRRLKEAHDIDFIVIDYLQLLSGSGSVRSQENRQNEISEVSRMLKNLARELYVPLLCAAQLSRKVEDRQGHRPMMSDLRESGSIEQDADQVLFLLRREYYDPDDRPGMAEVIVGKNRHGAVGSVQLTYRKEIVQFANYTGTPFREDG